MGVKSALWKQERSCGIIPPSSRHSEITGTFQCVSGLHYRNCTVTSFLETLYKVADILEEETRKHSEKSVIFRSTLPQHFYAGPNFPPGYFIASRLFRENKDKYKNIGCWNHTFTKMHWTSFYLEKVSRLYGFGFLDSAPLYTDRWDLHIIKTVNDVKEVDCTHYCYTPEHFVPEVALLNELLP